MSGEPPLQLEEHEFRQVVRLLSDALAPDDGHVPKVGRLMHGLAEMLGADGWLFLRTLDEAGGPGAFGGEAPVTLDELYGGIVEQAALKHLPRANGEPHPLLPAPAPGSAADAAPSPDATSPRSPPTLPAVHQSGHCPAALHGAGLDAYTLSTVALADARGRPVASSAVFLRAPGRPAFAPRLAHLAHLIVSECGPLHRHGLLPDPAPATPALTARQQEVLDRLVAGRSVKQVAYDLNLSPHTVNDHVKKIYRHYGVKTRAALLRRFMR